MQWKLRREFSDFGRRPGRESECSLELGDSCGIEGCQECFAWSGKKVVPSTVTTDWNGTRKVLPEGGVLAGSWRETGKTGRGPVGQRINWYSVGQSLWIRRGLGKPCRQGKCWLVLRGIQERPAEGQQASE